MDPRQLLQIWTALQQLSKEVKRCVVLPVHDRVPWPNAEMHVVPTVVACLSGHTRIRLGETQVQDLMTGEVAILDVACVHEHLPSRHFTMEFAQGFQGNRADMVLSGASRYVALVAADPYRERLDRVLIEGDECKRKLLFQKYLQNILDDKHFEPQAISDPAARMYAYIRHNCWRPIGVHAVIAASGLSRSRAFAVYKQAFGVSPLFTISQRRCYMAQAYMRSGYGIAEAALKAGFPSRRHMTRAFSEIIGVTPQDWRRGALEEANR